MLLLPYWEKHILLVQLVANFTNMDSANFMKISKNLKVHLALMVMLTNLTLSLVMLSPLKNESQAISPHFKMRYTVANPWLDVVAFVSLIALHSPRMHSDQGLDRGGSHTCSSGFLRLPKWSTGHRDQAVFRRYPYMFQQVSFPSHIVHRTWWSNPGSRRRPCIYHRVPSGSDMANGIQWSIS